MKYVSPMGSWSPTDEELLWLGRMLVGERGPGRHDQTESAALLWTIANRWLLHPARRKWSTFTYLLRRFSQPINPRWMAGGDLAERYAGTPAASPARLRRRARIASIPWGKLPAKIRVDLLTFALGELAPPDAFFSCPKNRMTNWASYSNVEKKYPGGVWLGGNYFFEDRALKLIAADARVCIDHWA